MEDHARRYGLDFFPTVFEVVDVDRLNAVAAYGGFPTRYPHWRFGMQYERLSKGYSCGLQKIYELVINNDPCYAYLLSSNGLTDHKLVMAHVYGHCDFFKNNYWFSQTNRKMIDEMANHGNRIRRYIDRFGVEEVESFIDVCLSVEDLIDPHSPFIKRFDDKNHCEFKSHTDEEDEYRPAKFRAKPYMDRYINPPEVVAKEDEAERRESEQNESFPSEPVRDAMLFILENSPLRPWQADVLSIVRDEAYYFSPQGQTKIMNEGWATYWHSTIMTRHGLEPDDVINYCDHTSGTLASSPTQLNPYKLGFELFSDIEDRWNRGRNGPEYDECDDLAAKRQWNTEAGVGREKIFEVRRIHNDLTFIDEFLTLEFCCEHKMFSFGLNENTNFYEIESREFAEVKSRLLAGLTHMGRPIIYVRDGNYKNRGELFLEHKFHGDELDRSYTKDTLESLQRLWQRPVHVETVVNDHVTVFSYDGSEHTTEKTDIVYVKQED